MKTNGHATLKILPATDSDQQVEVIIALDDGRLALRYSTWTEGLGWCTQKTIWLDETQVEALHRALTIARARLRQARAQRGERVEAAKVIPFPIIKES